jgi:ubiquinone/menaquinone biosynthesis C-methylase UbiE
MLELARERTQQLGRNVDLRVGDAQNLAFPDGRFDTVVATLLLSTVPDPQRAMHEMYRVMKQGGRLLLLDMARSPFGAVRWVEQLLEPLCARSRFTLMRDPLDYLNGLGFTVEHTDHFRFGVIEEVVARKN